MEYMVVLQQQNDEFVMLVDSSRVHSSRVRHCGIDLLPSLVAHYSRSMCHALNYHIILTLSSYRFERLPRKHLARVGQMLLKSQLVVLSHSFGGAPVVELVAHRGIHPVRCCGPDAA